MRIITTLQHGTTKTPLDELREEQRGDDRQGRVYGVAESLKQEGWIKEWIPSTKYDATDRAGSDIIFPIPVNNRAEFVKPSITGAQWLAEHQRLHPDKPNIIVNLDIPWDRSREVIEGQILLTLPLEILKRTGGILRYEIQRAEAGRRTAGWRVDFNVLRRSTGYISLVVCSPDYPKMPPDLPQAHARSMVFERPIPPSFDAIVIALSRFVF